MPSKRDRVDHLILLLMMLSSTAIVCTVFGLVFAPSWLMLRLLIVLVLILIGAFVWASTRTPGVRRPPAL